MKLFEVPPKTRVRLVGTDTEVFFDHLDGMYSYCVTDKQEVCNLVAWEEVEIVLDKESKVC